MSAGVDLRSVNAALDGETELMRFDLVRVDGRYRLALTLGRNGKPGVQLCFSDVQNLELNPAGDGFDRLLRLVVEDLVEDGLDRIRYGVEERERETLFLHCADLSFTLL